MVVSGVFLGSYFTPLRTLGVLFIVGFLLSLVGDMTLLQGLLNLFGKRGSTRKARPDHRS